MTFQCTQEKLCQEGWVKRGKELTRVIINEFPRTEDIESFKLKKIDKWNHYVFFASINL